VSSTRQVPRTTSTTTPTTKYERNTHLFEVRIPRVDDARVRTEPHHPDPRHHARRIQRAHHVVQHAVVIDKALGPQIERTDGVESRHPSGILVVDMLVVHTTVVVGRRTQQIQEVHQHGAQPKAQTLLRRSQEEVLKPHVAGGDGGWRELGGCFQVSQLSLLQAINIPVQGVEGTNLAVKDVKRRDWSPN
jgi:hypothetical protein